MGAVAVIIQIDRRRAPVVEDVEPALLVRRVVAAPTRAKGGVVAIDTGVERPDERPFTADLQLIPDAAGADGDDAGRDADAP